jgi:MacB-like periplasmic core domain
MSTTLNDLRYAIRLLARHRVFTLLALSTLALGIGANSAIFAVVNAVLLRPLPFRDPGRLVLIEDVLKSLTAKGIEVTPSDLIEFQRTSHSFESVAGYTPISLDLTGLGAPERLEGLRASAQLFSLLGVSPVVGRTFTSEEDRPGSGVAIISYRLWQRRFSSTPETVGRVVDLDRQPTRIVGVLPKDVEFPLPGLSFGGGHDIWVPLGITEQEQTNIGNYIDAVVARLKPGVSISQAQSDVHAIAHRIWERYPPRVRALAVLDAHVASVTERVVHDTRKLLWLLVGAGLLVRSLVALHAVAPGFDVQHVLTARVALPSAAYQDAASGHGFFERAIGNLAALPGVSAAGAATVPLLSLRNQRLITLRDPAIPSSIAVNATVLGDYFQAVGIRIRTGRLFDSRDRAGSPPVLIVNETLAHQYFPGKDAVGQLVKLGSRESPNPWYTIIGVVTDVKNDELANNVRPQFYESYAQLPDAAIMAGFGKSMVLAVKAASEPEALTSEVRATVAKLDPELPVSDLQTVRAQVEASLAPEWFQTGLVASFAGLALLLAAIGIYGVVSYAVTQRTQEIGIRMALGAGRGGVLGMVIGQGMKSVLAGVALGLAASFALSRLMTEFLFGVQPTDWITFSFAPVVLCLVALVANLAPARRAASVDPIIALRYE